MCKKTSKNPMALITRLKDENKELREKIRRINISRGQMRKKLDTYEKKIIDIENLRAIKCDNDEYLRGQANGLILALATMKNESPKFLQKRRKHD